MFKIKDRIILGIISGMFVSSVGQIINVTEHKLKFTDVVYSQVASRLFFDKKKSETISGQIFSSILDLITAGVFGGIFTTYLISATGKDRAIIKGIGVWTTQMVLINGFFSRIVLKVKTEKLSAPFFSLFDHILMGALNGFIVSKFGDDSLFPNSKVKKEETLPLIATNQDFVNDHDQKKEAINHGIKSI